MDELVGSMMEFQGFCGECALRRAAGGGSREVLWAGEGLSVTTSEAGWMGSNPGSSTTLSQCLRFPS